MYSKLELISGTTIKNKIYKVICTNCNNIKQITEASLLRNNSCNCKYINTIINNITIINYSNNYFTCKCFCSKIFTSKNILSGKQKSCGCLDYGKYNYLTYNKDGIFCDCGKKVNISRRNLLSGNSTSCGCYQKIKAKENLIKATNKIKIYSDQEAIQRDRWRNNYNDMDFNLYQILSNKNCFYCGQKPNQKYIVNNITYFRNGIDKVNNSLPHLIFNSVPCCNICNKMKRKRSLIDFYQWIFNFSPSNFTIKSIDPDKQVCKIFKHYSDTDLTINEFAYLISQPCYYCKSINSNNWNGFKYNGLDRIDNNLNHNKQNIVPCCKHCNYAKRNMKYIDFINHLNKLKAYNEKSPG
jgi:hypothetical protein